VRVPRFPDSFRLAVGSALIALVATGCSRSAQTYVDRGDYAIAKGDVAAAVLEYRNAVAKDPLLTVAHQKLAAAYFRQGNGAGAVAEYVRVADLLPNDEEAQIQAGSLLLLAGRFADARGRADKALAVNPGNVDALVLRANALAGLTDLEGALAQMQEAVRLDPSAMLQTNLGAIQAARGNRPEAEAAFRQAVSTDPKSVAAQLALGHFLWSANKTAEAETAFSVALALEPGHTLANRWMATLYLQTDRAAAAEPFFRKVAASGEPDAAVALADYYVGVGRAGDALPVLDTLAADARYWALAKARTAAVMLAQGRPDDAMRTVDEVIAKQPAMSAARVVRGRLLLAARRADEAVTEAQTVVKAEPQNAEAQYLLASAHEARHDLPAAAAGYAEVLRINPRASIAQLRLAMIELQRDDLGAATKLAEQAASAQPGGMAAQLVLARGLVARGELDRAAGVTQALVQASPESAIVQNQVGMLAIARGDKAGARIAFERALALNGTLVEPLSMLVALDVADGKAAAARARIEPRLAKTPSNSLVLALAGRTWASTGDPVKGEQLLRRAIDADASNFEAYSDLASLYVAQRKPDQAVKAFDTLAGRQPNAVGSRTMAALIVQATGNEAEARRRYERIVEAEPRAAVAANNLAWIYASRGEQLDRALQLAQAAKAEIPDHPEVNDTLGFVYLKKQLPALAIAPLQAAIATNPRNPSFHYHLGTAYAESGNKAGAKRALEQALKLQPDFEGASDARKVLGTLD
jgi:tetratricopeptide (TPR) repeat protein